MPTTKIATPADTEFRLNISDEIEYHRKRAEDPQLMKLIDRVLTREAIVDYFNRLKDTGKTIYLGYEIGTTSDLMKICTYNTNEIYGAGRIVEVSNREVVFAYKILPIWEKSIRKLEVHLDNTLFDIHPRTLKSTITFARIVGVIRNETNTGDFRFNRGS